MSSSERAHEAIHTGAVSLAGDKFMRLASLMMGSAMMTVSGIGHHQAGRQKLLLADLLERPRGK